MFSSIRNFFARKEEEEEKHEATGDSNDLDIECLEHSQNLEGNNNSGKSIVKIMISF